MKPSLNDAVVRTSSAPISEAAGWAKDYDPKVAGPLLDLAQAVPNYPPADALLSELAKDAQAPETAFYTPILGIPELRQAYAEAVSKHYQTKIDAENVAITAGGNHAFCMTVMALAGHGDQVLLGQPYYFNHEMWLTMQGIEMVPLPCAPGPDGMLPDPDEAAALIGPKTRAIALVSPNNPTGTVYSPALLARFLDLAVSHGIALILDETYKDFLPPDQPPHGLFDLPSGEENFIHLFSFSKSYSLTGYRVGALIAGKSVMAGIEKVADTVTICPPHIGQRAALYGLQNLDGWRNTQTSRMSVLAAALDDAFARYSPPYEVMSRGAFFAYLRHPFPQRTAVEVSRALIEKAGLLLLPGSYFGQGQDQYLRLAFANLDEAGLDEAARRLASIDLGF